MKVLSEFFCRWFKAAAAGGPLAVVLLSAFAGGMAGKEPQMVLPPPPSVMSLRGESFPQRSTFPGGFPDGTTGWDDGWGYGDEGTDPFDGMVRTTPVPTPGQRIKDLEMYRSLKPGSKLEPATKYYVHWIATDYDDNTPQGLGFKNCGKGSYSFTTISDEPYVVARTPLPSASELPFGAAVNVTVRDEQDSSGSTTNAGISPVTTMGDPHYGYRCNVLHGTQWVPLSRVDQLALSVPFFGSRAPGILWEGGTVGSQEVTVGFLLPPIPTPTFAPGVLLPAIVGETVEQYVMVRDREGNILSNNLERPPSRIDDLQEEGDRYTFTYSKRVTSLRGICTAGSPMRKEAFSRWERSRFHLIITNR